MFRVQDPLPGLTKMIEKKVEEKKVSKTREILENIRILEGLENKPIYYDIEQKQKEDGSRVSVSFIVFNNQGDIVWNKIVGPREDLEDLKMVLKNMDYLPVKEFLTFIKNNRGFLSDCSIDVYGQTDDTAYIRMGSWWISDREGNIDYTELRKALGALDYSI